MPDEVKTEIGRHFSDRAPIVEEDSRKLPKLNDEAADCILTGLTVRIYYGVIPFVFPLCVIPMLILVMVLFVKFAAKVE